MKYLLFILLLISNRTFSQESPSDFWKNQCDFKTDGLKKSLGMKIKLSVPCNWKQADGERPHVVKKFLYNYGENSAFSTLTITEMPEAPSNTEVDYMFTEKGLRELIAGMGTFLTGRKLKIDGQDCGEITLKMTRNHPIGTLYVYSLQYYFIYYNKIVVLGYAVSSPTDENSKKMFDSYKMLFRGLAGNTVIFTKWD